MGRMPGIHVGAAVEETETCGLGYVADKGRCPGGRR